MTSAEAFRDAQSDAELVTKKDLQIELAPLKGDLLLLKWMMGLDIGRGSGADFTVVFSRLTPAQGPIIP